MKDFKKSTIYQIYSKSFMDSNQDGLGDINGVTSQLDYLEFLGVDYIWMTPFFKSPLNDNGYDIADYYSIDPVFGSMEDLEKLILEAKKRKIGLMFDMVFNHTSTEHEWFQKALAGDEEYMNYYYFVDGNEKEPPTNWESKFGGNAWEYVPHLKKWYLHLFDVTQADLNWENSKVREELKNVLRFWKQKGIKGFRFDVVNLVSKPVIFENDTKGDGRRFYTDGPRIHEYLKELVRDSEISDMITVGEMSSTTTDNCIRYTNPAEKELSMCFSFHHLKVDYKDGNKWELMEPDMEELKDILTNWQEKMLEGNGWNALFLCNHDQPRAVSRFGDDKSYWKESSKMLATLTHMLRGTPYVFQGEEIGMTNGGYSDISLYRDVESLNYYQIMLENGKTKEEAIEVLKKRSRDNGRMPMQWDDSEYAGFSTVEPWISNPDNYKKINVASEMKDKDSILYYYKSLIALRKQYDVIAYGDFKRIMREETDIYAYERQTEKEKLIVLNNLTKKTVVLKQEIDMADYEVLICNYAKEAKNKKCELRPYESVVYYKKK